jgi:TRAP-type C4-dicarboxylate transport system permease large subunit
VFFTLVVSVATRRLAWKGLMNSIGETLKISCMVFMLVAGAIIFGRFLAVTRLPFLVADFAAARPVPRYAILALVLMIYLIGGCFMDSLGFLVLTIPIFFPIVTRFNFDPIWFGVIIVMVGEMGVITPPVGVNVFVIKGIAPDVPLQTIYRGIMPFLVAIILLTVLLLLFPQIATFLPTLVYG